MLQLCVFIIFIQFFFLKAIPKNIERIVRLSPLHASISYFIYSKNGASWSDDWAFPRRSRCCKHFPFHKLSFSVSSPFSCVYTTTTWPHVACLTSALGVFRSLFSSAIHTQNGPQQGGGVSAPVQRLRLLQRWRSRWHGAGPMLHFPGCSHHTQPIVPPGRDQHTHVILVWYSSLNTVGLSSTQSDCVLDCVTGL